MRSIISVVTVMIMSLTINGQERKLPAPSFLGGMPMNEVVANRHSIRNFDAARELDDATLGQLLWMTVGVNRPDAEPSNHGSAINRSNPTARNWQEIHAYLFDRSGVWLYEPKSHSLLLVAKGDYRALVAGTAEFSQDFVMEAPCSIVLVADIAGLPGGEHVRSMALVDAGIACENLNLACTSMGIATVPRATMDVGGISSLLGLSADQFPVLNNPLGYEKK